MEAVVDGHAIAFSGSLTEADTIPKLRATLQEAYKNITDKSRVILDFHDVKYANSSGLKAWLVALDEERVPVVYVRVPVWMVYQISFMSEFLEGDVDIQSICVPFYSTVKDANVERILVIGKDIPILEAYDDFQPEILEEGEPLEPDYAPEMFFGFIPKLELTKKRQ